MHWFTKSMSHLSKELKGDLFKPLHSHASHDPELRKNKEIRVLEIGVGTGTKFGNEMFFTSLSTNYACNFLYNRIT